MRILKSYDENHLIEVIEPFLKEHYDKGITVWEIEDIYANEYYQANQNGYKPTLRLVISSLNYNNEQELIYMDVKYTIIRIQKKNLDELILVCERKINNV